MRGTLENKSLIQMDELYTLRMVGKFSLDLSLESFRETHEIS